MSEHNENQKEIDEIVSQAASRILEFWDQWEGAAEQVCQIEQTDEPYRYMMTQELTDVINFAVNKARMVFMKRDIP